MLDYLLGLDILTRIGTVGLILFSFVILYAWSSRNTKGVK